MYKDPQDLFRDMDEMFACLSARMTREFPVRESPVFSYPDILEREGESSMEHGLLHEECGQDLNRVLRFTILMTR